MDTTGRDYASEIVVGTEDVVFRADNGWFWQARGTSDCWGPFDTADDAIADYDAT